MSARRHLQSIIDLAEARLNHPPLEPNAVPKGERAYRTVEHDLGEILRLAKKAHRLIDGRPYPKTGSKP